MALRPFYVVKPFVTGAGAVWVALRRAAVRCGQAVSVKALSLLVVSLQFQRR